MILDVGSDHGYASIFLGSRGKKVYATEVADGPYKTLCRNLNLYPEADVTPLMMDGLSALPDDVTSVMILGMGGDTIYKILSDSLEKLEGLHSIVIEPQSKFRAPISFLLSHGFMNDAGCYVFEKHHYPILHFVHGPECVYSKDELNFGPYPYQNRDKKLLQYFRFLLSELESLPDSVKENRRQDILKLRRLVHDFEEAHKGNESVCSPLSAG